MPWPQLANKRLLSYLSWRCGGRRSIVEIVLDALVRDLHDASVPITSRSPAIWSTWRCRRSSQRPAAWLRRLGPPEWVSVVPGQPRRPGHCAAGRWLGSLARLRLVRPRYAGYCDADFPFLRRRGPLAIIGLSTAFPSRPRSRDRAARRRPADAPRPLLERLEPAPACRVLLLHHSPVDGLSRRRRRLIDAAQLRRCSPTRRGSRAPRPRAPFSFGQVAGASGPVPVFGAPRHRASIGRGADGTILGLRDRRERRTWRIVAESRVTPRARRFRPRRCGSVVAQQDERADAAPRAVGRGMPKIGLISNPAKPAQPAGPGGDPAGRRRCADVIHVATEACRGLGRGSARFRPAGRRPPR